MRQPHSESRALDLLVVGDINPDIVVADPDPRPEFGQRERLVERITLTVGGSSAIMAAAAARLGLKVALIGVVGDDALGRYILSELTGRGIDVSHCRIDPVRPTGASVILARGTDRAILTAIGTIGDLRADEIPQELVARSRHLHIASFYLQAALRPGLPSLLRRARGAGTTTSVDPNWDPSDRWDGGLLALLPITDVFLPNEAEALRITGRSTVEEAARALADRGPDGSVVAVKRGARGGMVASRTGGIAEVPGFGVESVDATGAGDAFDAGFLAAWLDGERVEEALAFAAVCGALSTRAEGGTPGQPTRPEANTARAGWSYE